MATLRLFASVRVAAGTGRATVDGDTVGEVVDAACARFGPDFAALVQACRVWRNGEPAEREDAVAAADEVAILPPVSGG
jgi:molybdopterin converting factor small subunit